MATKPSKPDGNPAHPTVNIDPVESWPTPAPAPIGDTQLQPEDTWMTFGLGADGEEEDRTVTVVFARFVDDETRTDHGLLPFSPVFPGGKRR
jgi:hypothetical protein